MKLLAGFVMGWFLSIFATHNYGWELTIKTGWVLLAITVFGIIISKTVSEDDANEVADAQ